MDAIAVLTGRRERLAGEMALLAARLEEIDATLALLTGAPVAPAVREAMPEPSPDRAPPAAPAARPESPARPKAEAAGRRDFPRELAAAIRDRGPLTPTQAAEAIGVHVATAGTHLRENPALFGRADPGNFKSPYTLTEAGRKAAG